MSLEKKMNAMVSQILSKSQIFRFIHNLISYTPQTHCKDMLGRLILNCLLIEKQKNIQRHANLL